MQSCDYFFSLRNTSSTYLQISVLYSYINTGFTTCINLNDNDNRLFDNAKVKVLHIV